MIDGHTGVVPPGPISNPEVKRALVDRGTGIFLGAAPTLSINLFIKKVDQKTLFLTKNVGEKPTWGFASKSPIVVCRVPYKMGARE